jgi:hypothetical protein
MTSPCLRPNRSQMGRRRSFINHLLYLNTCSIPPLVPYASVDSAAIKRIRRNRRVFIERPGEFFGPSGSLVSGKCGSANRAVTNTAPTANLCNAGTPSAVAGTGPWFWSCAGSGGGATASCSTAAASTAAVSCPRGTTYVSAGDGCTKAQPTGSVQRKNFFTGFIPGAAYAARPPWNVAGVPATVGSSSVPE